MHLIFKELIPRNNNNRRKESAFSLLGLRRMLCLSQRQTWRFYTPIAANLIASENRKRFLPPIDADTPGDFFRRSRRCGSFENSCDKIAQPDGLALLAIHSITRRKLRERAHLANQIKSKSNQLYFNNEGNAGQYFN